jgi:hypothetical protein
MISSDSILHEIEKRKVVPIPRWHFLIKRFSFWILAIISVLTGSISMATAIYVFLDNDFIADQDYINRYFDQQPLIEDIVKSIPYLWLTALVLFILVAYYGFRHTKKGYRYPTTRVIAGSLLLSLLLSVGLNAFDVGQVIHRYLVENVQVYNKLIYANENRWTQSSKGWLSGKVMVYQDPQHLLVLRDFKKRIWQIDLRKAEMRQGTRIALGNYLKITGVRTGQRTFEAKTILAWEKKYHKHVRPLIDVVPSKKSQDSLSRGGVPVLSTSGRFLLR